ncbi:hypothetical protein Q5P01_021022 [Channa striata]|uniref:Uncharacterized protein n=1 Tax=Channa striata TaxID=64152 RepID=A0AA88S336_CHASR|nr:hypothetical protein Q5P01_021022 [Channa striata]
MNPTTGRATVDFSCRYKAPNSPNPPAPSSCVVAMVNSRQDAHGHTPAASSIQSKTISVETRQDLEPAARSRTTAMPQCENTSTESHNYEPLSRNTEESLSHME